MLAAITVDELLRSEEVERYGVAYIYCNYKSDAAQDTTSLLASILKQLCQCQPPTLNVVEELYQKHSRTGTKPSLDDLNNTLQIVTAQFPYVYVVVDALDECSTDTRRQLLDILFGLQKAVDIRLMTTSRYVEEGYFKDSLRLEVRSSPEDIKRFVEGQIYRLPACIRQDNTLQEDVKTRIVEAADGM
jgi:hypothetical protein